MMYKCKFFRFANVRAIIIIGGSEEIMLDLGVRQAIKKCSKL